MINIERNVYKINKNTINWLTQKGVKVPDTAKTVDYILAPRATEYTELYTFKDNKNLRLSQQKHHTNKITNQTDIQIREYDYITRDYSQSKLAEVRQTSITSQGEETNEKWRFYHAKDGYPVRFSHKAKGSENNNYLEADGVYTDRNGLKVRPISMAEYLDKRSNLDDNHFVDAPWTLKQSITTTDQCGTDSVKECTVVGIYGDKGVSLNHFNPINKANKDFEHVELGLLEQLEQQGKNAKAFVIGSCEEEYVSNKQFKNIIDMFAVNHVPFSSYKTGDRVLYDVMEQETRLNKKNKDIYNYGIATLFEWEPGQHIIYENGEIQLANVIIDSELKKGNTDPTDLVRKSFGRISCR